MQEMRFIQFEVIRSVSQCKKLWKEKSPKSRLWDIWEFNYCFYNPREHKPFFIAGYMNEKCIGLLPMWFDKKAEEYYFFGGFFPERRTFFLDDKEDLPQFLEKCSKETI